MIEYRLSWEMPSPHQAEAAEARYGRDMSHLGWTDDWFSTWHRVETRPADPWDQYHTLKRWAATREQPIRNVVLEQRELPQPDEGWTVVT